MESEVKEEAKELKEPPIATPETSLGVDTIVIEQPTGCFGQLSRL